MADQSLAIFEFDVCVPAQKFRIEYTLVEHGGFPFVPEFILRLLKISPFPAIDVARFFGFTPKEISTALVPFFQQGHIVMLEDGNISLTEKGVRLFDGGSEMPMVKSRQEHRKSFSFDVLGFSYLGSRPKSDNPRRSISLSASAEIRSESVKFVADAFQSHIHDIYRKGDLCGQPMELHPPELYKISQITKEKDIWFKVEDGYHLNTETLHLDFSDLKGIADSEQYISQRTNQLNALQGQNNLEPIRDFADAIGDTQTLHLLDSGILDFSKLISLIFSSFVSGDKDEIRILGSSQLTRNWDHIDALIKKHSSPKSSGAALQPSSLTWIAPSTHDMWGKCSRHGQALSRFAEYSNLESKGRTLFDPRLLVPLADTHDRVSKRERNSTVAIFLKIFMRL